MRRIIIIGTALAVLVGAAAAYAAYNSYTATLSFSPGKAGSAKAPSPFQMSQLLTASAPSGQRAAPLTDIKTKIFGVVADGKDFPKCTDSQILANTTLYDKACPKGSLVAQGPVNSLLGPSNSSAASKGFACNPYLHVYNAGQGKLAFFFVVIPPKYTCGTLTTGSTPPYNGTVSRQGSYLVVDVPLPPFVSTKVANQPGLYGSLIKEQLTWSKMTKKVNGKTVAYQASTACKGGKRPYSVTYTATDYSGGSETHTVSHTAGC